MGEMMTDSIPLDDLTTQEQLTRRDQWGRYLVVPPTGEPKPLGYTRVTTVAKALDTGGGLAPWKAAMTACGIIMRRGLRARWEALVNRTNGDPWYASPESKSEARTLVEECAAAGGADERREVGDALHALTALVDAGQDLPHLTPETARDVQRYSNGLAAHGITIVPGAIEVVTVLDTFRVAGTFDRLVNVPGFELPLIADIKTGASLDYSWQSFAVQLAAYAHGEAIYLQGPAHDGSQDQRRPMPAVDLEWGVILHLDSGTDAPLTVYLVDLVQGWEAFAHSMWARGWHNARPAEVFKPDDLTGTLQRSVKAATSDRRVSAPTGSVPSDDAGPSQVQAEPVDALTPDVRAWLQERVNVVGAHPDARTALVTWWGGSGIPTLKSGAPLRAEQVEAVEQVLNGIERRYSLSFPPTKPGDELASEVARVFSLFPGTTDITDTD